MIPRLSNPFFSTASRCTSYITTRTKSSLQRSHIKPSTRSLSPLQHSSTMHMVATLDDGLADITCPHFRSADFSGDSAQILVATQLRYAWPYDPAPNGPESVGVFMRENHTRTPEEQAALPVYPDKEAVHTPWRDEVYEMWNHVFYDVMRFLGEANPAFGHFHPPKHDVIALNFPPAATSDDGQETENIKVLTKTWDVDILLIPAHLEPGVVVRLETFSQREVDGVTKDIEKIRGKFSKDKFGEIWYLRRGVEARFFIEGDWDKNSKGLAAVMVYANLCNSNDCNQTR